MSDDQVTFVLVNLNQVESREVVVQAGAYGEHQFTKLTWGPESLEVDGSHVAIHLAPGCGVRFTANVQRYVNQPTLRFPW